MPQFVHLLNINKKKKANRGKRKQKSGRERGGGDVSAGFFSSVQGRGEGKETHLRSLISLKNCEEEKKGGRCAPTTVKHRRRQGRRGLPVCGCNHPAGPSSYPVRSRRGPCTVSLAFNKKKGIIRARASFSNQRLNPPCFRDILQKHWTCVNGIGLQGVSCANSRDVFGNDIY